MKKLSKYEQETYPDDIPEEIKKLQEELEKYRQENLLLKKKLASVTNPAEAAGNKKFKDFEGFFAQSIFHKAFLNKTPFLMWAKDMDGRFLAVNSTFAKCLGKNPSEFKGLTGYDLFPKMFADKYREDEETVVKKDRQITIEEIIPLEKGFYWHETIKLPLKNRHGEIFGVAGFAKDITERKKYEQAVSESEEKFRELAENTSDSFILRTSREIIYVNPAFEQIYGYSKEDLRQDMEIIRKCIHSDDRERITKVFDSLMYKTTNIFNEQYRIIRKDGTISWIWNRSYPVWNDKGEVYRIVSVATNITEIKKLEERLRKSQYQKQAILDNIPYLAWLKDNNGKYVSANKSFCSYFKVNPEDVPGKTDYDFCEPEKAEEFMKKDKKVLEERKSMLFYEVEEGDSGKRYSETYKTPVINEEGKVIGITGISKDITEQKLSEQALLRSEEKFKDIVTLLPEVVFETDTRGIIRYANLRSFQMMEYSQDDLDKGIHIFKLIADHDIPRIKSSFENMQAGKELKGAEFTVITKKGRRIPVMVFTNNIYHDGQWAGVRGVVVDITRRKKAENQEREYQAKLLFLSNTALDFLGMTQTDEIFRYIGSKLHEFIKNSEVLVNSFDADKAELKLEYHSFTGEKAQEINELLGITPEEFVLKINGDQINDLRKNSEHLRVFENGFFETSFGQIPESIAFKMEKIVNAKKMYGMALMKSGILFGSVLIVLKNQDLQDQPFIETFIYQAAIALHRRQLETELLMAKNHAEESDMLKTAFLANMSHEIRTPMNGILGLTQLLSNDDLTETERKEYLKMIDINGNLLLNLVNDIIDISKIESNQVDVYEAEFSVNSLLNELESFIQSEKMVKNKGEIQIKIIKSFTDPEAYIIADQPKIKQIFTNLISNSLKFTHAGEIALGYEYENENILFFVKDSGIGISDDKLKFIFERFTQGDQSLTRTHSGSGLGLAICKGFVERMGGEIWVESIPGEGSDFYFRIPLKRVSVKEGKTIEVKKDMKSFNWDNLNILVVEDNYVSFKLLEASLNKTGVNILHAEDGQDAIDKVTEHPEIDLVLMDIQLPVLNGYDSTRAIKEIRPELPVIAQTANAMDDDRLKCLNAGCSDYITKPIVLDKLLGVVNDYIIRDK